MCLHASDHSPRRSQEVWSVAGGVVPVRMMGKAMHCGFLGMIFLASGTSALQCHSLNYVWTAVSKGDYAGDHISTEYKIVNCSNACLEAQLKLGIADTVLLVTKRGCADKEQKDGKGHITTDNPHFIMRHNESYCSRDLCNDNMSDFYLFNWNPESEFFYSNLTAPEESGSIQCYAGITFDSNDNLKKVTCRKGYDQCYSGQARVKAGRISAPVFIKTCSRPKCTEFQTLSFGPIQPVGILFNLLGSCCLGNYCNGAETDARSHGKETVVTCWFSYFALCAISLRGALLY